MDVCAHVRCGDALHMPQPNTSAILKSRFAGIRGFRNTSINISIYSDWKCQGFLEWFAFETTTCFFASEIKWLYFKTIRNCKTKLIQMSKFGHQFEFYLKAFCTDGATQCFIGFVSFENIVSFWFSIPVWHRRCPLFLTGFRSIKLQRNLNENESKPTGEPLE